MTNVLTAMILAAITITSAQMGQAASPTVTACLSGFNEHGEIHAARLVANRILAQAAVSIDWREGHCPAGVLRIAALWDTPDRLKPGAFASALSSQEGYIDVYADRISRAERTTRPFLLGYILAHEITHILQGVVWHADRGVMKAERTPDDLTSIRRMRVNLTDLDVQMIHDGIAQRAQSLQDTNGTR
jgi:hypothetical protein